MRFDSAAGGALVGDFTALRLSLSACFGAGASESSANSCRVPSLLSVTFCCPERGASTTNATTRTLIPAVGCMVALLTTPLSHATLTTRAKKYTRACGRRAPHRVVRRTTARRTPRRGVWCRSAILLPAFGTVWCVNDRPLSVDAYVPLIATTFLDNLSDSWSIPHSRIEEKSCWLLKQRQHASCALSCTRLAFANRATGELSTDQHALNEARSTRSRTRRARCDARWLRYARWLRSVRRVHGEGVHLRMYASQKHERVRVCTTRFCACRRSLRAVLVTTRMLF